MAKDGILEQAQFLFETIRLIQLAAFPRHHASGCGGSETADLTMPQVHALMTLASHEPLPLKDLAGILGVSPPSASAMVDRLVEGGYVLREQSRTDRRQVVLQVAPKGREARGRIRETILGSLSGLLDKIGPDYAAQWCAVHRRIREVLAEETGLPPAKQGE